MGRRWVWFVSWSIFWVFASDSWIWDLIVSVPDHCLSFYFPIRLMFAVCVFCVALQWMRFILGRLIHADIHTSTYVFVQILSVKRFRSCLCQAQFAVSFCQWLRVKSDYLMDNRDSLKEAIKIIINHTDCFCHCHLHKNDNLLLHVFLFLHIKAAFVIKPDYSWMYKRHGTWSG